MKDDDTEGSGIILALLVAMVFFAWAAAPAIDQWGIEAEAQEIADRHAQIYECIREQMETNYAQTTGRNE